MTIKEIAEIGTWIIVSCGGAGAIIVGFSNFFGNILARRYEEKIRTKFQHKINEYQSQLDIIKQTSLRYSDRQFEFYSKLWSSLYDLKLLADDLWQEANSKRLDKYSKQLKITKTEIEKSSLFIEDEHYRELILLINDFSDYQMGKKNLVDYRNTDYKEHEVQEMIIRNGDKKRQYEALIITIKSDLKRQIRGENINE